MVSVSSRGPTATWLIFAALTVPSAREAKAVRAVNIKCSTDIRVVKGSAMAALQRKLPVVAASMSSQQSARPHPHLRDLRHLSEATPPGTQTPA